MKEIKLIKFSAPKIMSVNGQPSPCECTDIITCAYCVQASLIFFYKDFTRNNAYRKDIISGIKKIGIRKVARTLNVPPSSVQYWFKTEHFPQWVLAKYVDCTNAHTNTHGT